MDIANLLVTMTPQTEKMRTFNTAFAMIGMGATQLPALWPK
jgi:hypothetical protein